MELGALASHPQVWARHLKDTPKLDGKLLDELLAEPSRGSRLLALLASTLPQPAGTGVQHSMKAGSAAAAAMWSPVSEENAVDVFEKGVKEASAVADLAIKAGRISADDVFTLQKFLDGCKALKSNAQEYFGKLTETQQKQLMDRISVIVGVAGEAKQRAADALLLPRKKAKRASQDLFASPSAKTAGVVKNLFASPAAEVEAGVDEETAEPLRRGRKRAEQEAAAAAEREQPPRKPRKHRADIEDAPTATEPEQPPKIPRKRRADLE